MNKLADFFEKLLPYLDWEPGETKEQLQERLINVARLCNEYGSEVRKERGI